MSLPYLTAGLPGIGGLLKQSPDGDGRRVEAEYRPCQHLIRRRRFRSPVEKVLRYRLRVCALASHDVNTVEIEATSKRARAFSDAGSE